MSRFNPKDQPHRRYNPLTGEWVVVSPHRTQRPWSGQVEEKPPGESPSYDPDCYLCPGNPRARGARNPDYASTFVFDNDFPALLADSPQGEIEERAENGPALIRAASERGICRVVCFSPRHDLSLAGMGAAGIRRVIE
ncbi:MAG: galactose-1-phosphate uridylyltransferase, partial [bacterium]